MIAAMPLIAPVAAVSIFAGEQIWPAESPTPRDWRRIGRNLAFGLILLAIGPLILWMQQRLWGGIPALLPLDAHLPPLWTLAVQFLVFDLWVYWTHRAYHRVPLLWRLHEPHHRDEAMDVTTSLRFHPGESLLSGAMRVVPCLAFGIDAKTLLAFETALIVAALFHHSNLKLPHRFERALSRLIVTPAIHWVHHHRVRADTDSNYSALLSVWDPLFGSRSKTQRTRGMAIGVEGLDDAPLPALLAAPFHRGSR
jgi:sterol desaturase/sphingolipid hydroxylase (fatty acid hydroxylase superfamily)